MKPTLSRTQTLATASALGLLLATQSGVAANGADANTASAGQQQAQTNANQSGTQSAAQGQPGQQGQNEAELATQAQPPLHEFTKLDTNEDEQVDWEEVQAAHGSALAETEWDKDLVMQRYDFDSDGQFTLVEYESFVAGLEAKSDILAPMAADLPEKTGVPMSGDPGEVDPESSLAENDTSGSNVQNQQESTAERRRPDQSASVGDADTQATAEKSAKQSGSQPASGSPEGAGSSPDSVVMPGEGAGSDGGVGTDTDGQNRNAATAQQTQDAEIAGAEGTGAVSTDASQSISQLNTAELQDRTLVDQRGEEVGQIQDIVTQKGASSKELVVSVGGVMGVGGRDVLVSTDEVVLQDDQVVWQNSESVNVEELPEYNPADAVSTR